MSSMSVLLLALMENLIPSGNWLSALASTTLILPSSAPVIVAVALKNANPASVNKVEMNTRLCNWPSQTKFTLVRRQCRLDGLTLRSV